MNINTMLDNRKIITESIELAAKYLPAPTVQEFEDTKWYPIEWQDRWDRKYLAALKIQRVKEIICYPGY